MVYGTQFPEVKKKGTNISQNNQDNFVFLEECQISGLSTLKTSLLSFPLSTYAAQRKWKHEIVFFLDESLWESPFSSVRPLGWDTAVGGPWVLFIFYKTVTDPRTCRWTMWGLHVRSGPKRWILELVTRLGIGASWVFALLGMNKSQVSPYNSWTLEMSVNLSDSDPVSWWPQGL